MSIEWGNPKTESVETMFPYLGWLINNYKSLWTSWRGGMELGSVCIMYDMVWYSGVRTDNANIGKLFGFCLLLNPLLQQLFLCSRKGKEYSCEYLWFYEEHIMTEVMAVHGWASNLTWNGKGWIEADCKKWIKLISTLSLCLKNGWWCCACTWKFELHCTPQLSFILWESSNCFRRSQL
jgi:hypothetical protein